ncbi:MAG: di-trans,poly-cis-decaprenylcistransferase [Cytophaga sp.]|nr:di-trans,poly-cis-decaprenylcistransferase [Undibacterium sp.]
MVHISSTKKIPVVGLVPHHIAIIMDGNGRWATKRFLPRVAGHAKGVEAVRGIVEACIKRNIKYLTLFAFSSENWRRPAEEVSMLMRLFVTALEREVSKMHANDVRLKVVGDLSRFDAQLQKMIRTAETKTANNKGLTVTICANYGGRWDVVQAFNRFQMSSNSGEMITEDQLAPYLSMAYAPEPDLFIRTGGETRISNFLLWQLAYSELYFSDTFWPDFDALALDEAINSYQVRERRFGRTSSQLTDQLS